MMKVILISGSAKNTVFMILMIVKNAVFLDFIPSSVAEVCCHFRGTWYPMLRIKEVLSDLNAVDSKFLKNVGGFQPHDIVYYKKKIGY